MVEQAELNDFRLEHITDGEGNDRLVLRDLTASKMSPLSVDFLDPKTIHRFKNGLSKSQPLSRALGLRSLRAQDAPFVFDATAGMGVDAFFIAALGCRVRAVERSPVVFALLEDGKRRLDLSADMRSVASRLTFELGDAFALLSEINEATRPDVVYLDPMYPEEGRSDSALPKKPMQMFRRLIGDDQDVAKVFEIACARAKERVVVKRPLHAEFLGEIKPTHVFKGKTARYDMYLVRSY
jgi:16S rRNA (guanine1516-N2)-methyltransferase